MNHLERFQQKLPEFGDAALISSSENQFYLSGFDFCDGYLLIFTESAYLLTDFRYTEAARREVCTGFSVVEVSGRMSEKIACILKEHQAKSLLLEEESVTLESHRILRQALGDLSFVAGGTLLLRGLRMFKDEAELEAMRQAQALTDAAFSHILPLLRPTMTEVDVALELEFFMRKNGASGVAFPTIAVSGKASSLPHGVPSARQLEPGFLTMDFGARLSGYCSDMTRTVVIGRADAPMRDLYETVLRAQTAALSAAGPGVSCRELDGVARKIIEDAGYHGTFGHSLGHGVGIEIHESPRVSPRCKEADRLSPGEVVTVEPGIYLAGRYGCRIEDMIVIQEDGIYNFTKSPKELIEIL